MTLCRICKRRPTVPGKCATRCRVCVMGEWGDE